MPTTAVTTPTTPVPTLNSILGSAGLSANQGHTRHRKPCTIAWYRCLRSYYRADHYSCIVWAIGLSFKSAV
eukprot:5873-Heterococcus_DN1.PRE.1